MSNPYSSPNPQPNPFADQPQTPPPIPMSSGGLVQYVKVIAILMIVQGALAIVMGLLYVGISVLFPAMVAANPPPSRGREPPPEAVTWMVFGVYLAMGLPAILGGILQVLAGIKMLSFRGRTLGIVSLVAGVGAVTTCYCAPTAILMTIFGLIVLLNGEVARAFQLRQQGVSPEQIPLAIHHEQWGSPGAKA